MRHHFARCLFFIGCLLLVALCICMTAQAEVTSPPNSDNPTPAYERYKTIRTVP